MKNRLKSTPSLTQTNRKSKAKNDDGNNEKCTQCITNHLWNHLRFEHGCLPHEETILRFSWTILMPKMHKTIQLVFREESEKTPLMREIMRGIEHSHPIMMGQRASVCSMWMLLVERRKSNKNDKLPQTKKDTRPNWRRSKCFGIELYRTRLMMHFVTTITMGIRRVKAIGVFIVAQLEAEKEWRTTYSEDNSYRTVDRITATLHQAEDIKTYRTGNTTNAK